jgi:flagellar motor component MotA
LDFFKTFDSSFASGFRFTPSEIANQLSTNADLKSKLNSLKKISADKKNNLERIKKIIESLERESFVALENEITDTYKVLASFKYLEEIIDTINIPEEIANEIPE